MATITILSDNRSEKPQFATEHGLSIYLKTDSHKLLLDTGASDLFLNNAIKAGIDLAETDYLFISHGHADHAGGLKHFLQANTKAKVLLSAHIAGRNFYSKREFLHDITSEFPAEDCSGRFLHTDKDLLIDNKIHIIAEMKHVYPLPQGNRNLYVRNTQGKYVHDNFRHELALHTDGILFTGCAHSGLLNILNACPWHTHTVIGGFHLLDARRNETYESEEELTALAKSLKKSHPHITFYTSHCTGDQAFDVMHPIMGEKLQRFSCGDSWKVGF